MDKITICKECGAHITRNAEKCKPCSYKNRKHPGHSLETRQKLSIAAKNRKYTQEGLRKMGATAKRMWQNPEYREKQIKSHLGFKPSKETLEKLSLMRKGKKRSQAWIDSIKRSKQNIPLSIRINMSNGKKGSKNPMWKGGVSPENMKARNSIEYKEWRKAVFTRDRYTCTFCGETNTYLHADHIKPFAHHPELRYLVSNGRTLCVPCHRGTSTYGSGANFNNLEQPMKRILVAGSHGFIGSNLVKFLKDKGYWVRGVDIKEYEERKDMYKLADEDILADMRKRNTLLRVTKGIDIVIWLCSNMGGVLFFHNNDYYPFLDNMTMDLNILKACEVNGVKRLLYSSSACIYPIHIQKEEGNAPKLSEDMIFPANSDQMYGWEKLMMTMLCKRAPFDARPMIFHTIYGEYQEHEGERMKFPTSIVRKVLQAKKDGKPIEIWGNGEQVRSYLYIKDALEKIYRVLTHPENVTPVNIASDQAVSCLDVAKLVCEIVGVEPNFTFTDAKPSGVLARNADNTLFEKTYGYKNKYSLRDGFTALVNYMKDKV